MARQVLVAHFTRSGNTRRIANLIQQQVGGTLYEIQPQEPYPSAIGESQRHVRTRFSCQFREQRS